MYIMFKQMVEKVKGILQKKAVLEKNKAELGAKKESLDDEVDDLSFFYR